MILINKATALEREWCGKTCRLCVALSLLASIAGVELSPLTDHEYGDKAVLPLHIPHETIMEFNLIRPLMVSGVSGTVSTTSII